jgi:lycopene cyclase domain-containing protein
MHWYALFPAILITAAFFITWDVYFTHLKIWGFNEAYLSGIYLINLPLEEWLFFITIPYAIVFTYAVIRQNISIRLSHKTIEKINVGITILLMVLAMINLDKTYTSVTFLLTAAFVVLHLFHKTEYLGHFYLSYLVIFLFPFLIVNGLLTGFGLPEPVVWYNNSENLGIRILTIPVEDFIYGFLLYLMNVTIYEKILESGESGKVQSKIQKSLTV